jgi:hypothetical protein
MLQRYLQSIKKAVLLTNERGLNFFLSFYFYFLFHFSDSEKRSGEKNWAVPPTFQKKYILDPFFRREEEKQDSLPGKR